jgi:hypothetical protein
MLACVGIIRMRCAARVPPLPPHFVARRFVAASDILTSTNLYISAIIQQYGTGNSGRGETDAAGNANVRGEPDGARQPAAHTMGRACQAEEAEKGATAVQALPLQATAATTTAMPQRAAAKARSASSRSSSKSSSSDDSSDSLSSLDSSARRELEEEVATGTAAKKKLKESGQRKSFEAKTPAAAAKHAGAVQR